MLALSATDVFAYAATHGLPTSTLNTHVLKRLLTIFNFEAPKRNCFERALLKKCIIQILARSATDVFAYAATPGLSTPTLNIDILKRPLEELRLERVRTMFFLVSRRPSISISKVLALFATNVFAYAATRCLPSPTLHIKMLKRLLKKIKRLHTIFPAGALNLRYLKCWMCPPQISLHMPRLTVSPLRPSILKC